MSNRIAYFKTCMSAIAAVIYCCSHFTFETTFYSVDDDDRGKENTFMLDDKPQKPASAKLKSRFAVIILHCTCNLPSLQPSV